jgi:predicted dienelactone hydrolase
LNRARTILFVSALTALVISLLGAQSKEKDASRYKVGLADRTFTPDGPYNWRGAKTHGLISVIWYPAKSSSVEQAQWIGPPDRPLLSAGRAMKDAALIAAPSKLPLILLSHGTGGSALNMAWLGTGLASHGYIAVAVNHPGNNGYDGYTPQGFSTWWERARDLSLATDKMLADSTFGHRIDAKRIGAAGFSLGGYTMIEIAGGITDPDALFEFCKSSRGDGICRSPPEFPNLLEEWKRLSTTDAEFQQALAHASDSFRDPRVRAAFAMAPALGPAFSEESLVKISIPVEIVAGSADENVPVASSARYFVDHIPGAKLTLFPEVGHYVFLPTCTEEGRKSLALLCTDTAGVDRAAIHAKTTKMALRFFEANLKR